MSGPYTWTVVPSMVPCVQITEPFTHTKHPSSVSDGWTFRGHRVVKVKFGLSIPHAIKRAQRWIEQHEDTQ